MDEKFLGDLAGRVRPSLIFTTQESFEAEFGAQEYIAEVKVFPNTNTLGFDLLIRAKRHLAYPPLITAIDVNLFQSSSTRDRLNDWRIEMAPTTTTPGASYFGQPAPLDTNTVHRFRLEILH